MSDIDSAPRPSRSLSVLPIYEGAIYPTDCTCAVRKPGRVLINDKSEWVPVCTQCGSLSENTGT